MSQLSPQWESNWTRCFSNGLMLIKTTCPWDWPNTTNIDQRSDFDMINHLYSFLTMTIMKRADDIFKRESEISFLIYHQPASVTNEKLTSMLNSQTSGWTECHIRFSRCWSSDKSSHSLSLVLLVHSFVCRKAYLQSQQQYDGGKMVVHSLFLSFSLPSYRNLFTL